MDDRSAYGQLGISATKADVHAAVAATDPGLFPGAFCRIGEDVLGGDPHWCCALHADGAGTKALVAYLIYRETGDADIFRGVAQDSLVMNLDDLLCVGASERFLLANTIGRNSFHVSGDVIREVIAGYGDCVAMLKDQGIAVVATGGETADLVDCVRTIVVDSCLATRMRRDQVIDNNRIEPGDVIVGLASSGQASYESKPNSGIGSNGLTLARHSLLCHDYAEQYPEALAPEVDPAVAYRGPFMLDSEPDGLQMSVGEALASPTRTYAPIIRQVIQRLGRQVHGIVHNTGGGQAKCKSFGRQIAYRKDNLLPCPPVFRLIAEHGQVSWREMYQTFNMGHRMELMVPAAVADEVIAISKQFGVDAQIVGRCERAESNEVTIDSEIGTFEYGPE